MNTFVLIDMCCTLYVLVYGSYFKLLHFVIMQSYLLAAFQRAKA